MDRSEQLLLVIEKAMQRIDRLEKALEDLEFIPGPAGKDGKNGKDGADGKDGRDGIVTAEALADSYKGVWSEGDHERGELVTWGGSLWLSLAKNADKPGEASENWKLIVKRGRDGKDGKDGKNGDKGEKGEKGIKGDKGEIGYA